MHARVSCNSLISSTCHVDKRRVRLADKTFFPRSITRARVPLLSTVPLCATGKITGSLHRCNFRVMQMICRCANPGIYARNADSLLWMRSARDLYYEITIAFAAAKICCSLNNGNENFSVEKITRSRSHAIPSFASAKFVIPCDIFISFTHR